jgi:phospholipid/cholesterol/gamma-HCH transport system substrate-binding protein
MPVSNLRGKVALVVAFAVVCAAIFVYLFSAAGGNLRVAQPYRVTVSVANAFQLVPNADVRAAGVKIGKVQRIDSDDGRVARVRIELEDDQAPVYRDARVLVRTKTLVGENYLDLEPGTPAAGRVPDNGSLPLRNAQDAVQLDQILSAMDARTRRSVSVNLRALGAGTGARGADLNRIFGAAKRLTVGGGRALAVLDAQRGQVARVVDDAGQVLQALGERRDDLRGFARTARQTAQAVGARDAQLAALVRELPATLRRARSSARTLGSFSGRATPVLSDLRAATRDLTPVMRDLGPVAADARELLTDVPRLTARVDPLLRRLRTFAAATRGAIGPLDGVLRQAGPAVAHLARYNKEIGAFFAGFGSALDTNDAVGRIGRVHAQIGESSFGALGPSARKALDALLAAGAVTKIHQVRSNPYPAPGTVGAPQPFDGHYPDLQPDPPARR